jgi:hypothetical protein
MTRTIALISVFAVAFVTSSSFSQETKPPPAAEPEGKDVRLDGEALAKEAIDGLAGGHWRRVVLIGSRVDATAIEALRHAASIHRLELYNGRYSGQIPRLQQVPGLVELALGGPLNGNDLEAVGELTSLEALTLPQELTINMVGARELARLTKLRSLNLYGVNLDDAGLAEFATLVNLEELELTHTRVTDEGLKVLAHFPKLKKLGLDRHWHTKQEITNACLAVIARLPELEHLTLSGKINNEGLAKIARMPKLKDLDIMSTEISSPGLKALGDSNIERLALSVNQLGEVAENKATLLKLRKLKSIWVSGKNFSEETSREWYKAMPDIIWGWHS